jgi:hypothetical protein
MIDSWKMLFLLALTAAACAGEGNVPPGHDGPPRTVDGAEPETRADSLRVLEAEIRQLVGDADASSVASCRSLPFGAKPCGGPWRYLVFSTETTDSAALASLVDRYNAIEARLNAEEGRMSDCALVLAPRLALEGGRCVAGEDAAGAVD